MAQISLSFHLESSSKLPTFSSSNLMNQTQNKPFSRMVIKLKNNSGKLVGVRCTNPGAVVDVNVMPVEKILHMNGGEKYFSYANHSLSQKKVIMETQPILEETIIDLYRNRINFLESINIVDLGCSSGPNTFLPAWQIIEALDKECKYLNRKPPTLQFFLNDLNGNDYNTVFGSLLPEFIENVKKEKGEEFASCFVAGAPGSFYGRLFPSRSLHFIYASHSLHFLSQVPELVSGKSIPLNKTSIYITKSSPPVVQKAYSNQFKNDFTNLLKLRAEEMIAGGRMVFTIACRELDDYKYGPSIWEPMGMALREMVKEGLIEESKLETFNIPFYEAYVDEVKELIESEGSFTINRLETFRHKWYENMDDGKPGLEFNNEAKARYVAQRIRAAAESIVASHFGGAIVDDLFERFCNNALKSIELSQAFVNNVAISMTRK